MHNVHFDAISFAQRSDYCNATKNLLTYIVEIVQTFESLSLRENG